MRAVAPSSGRYKVTLPKRCGERCCLELTSEFEIRAGAGPSSGVATVGAVGFTAPGRGIGRDVGVGRGPKAGPPGEGVAPYLTSGAVPTGSRRRRIGSLRGGCRYSCPPGSQWRQGWRKPPARDR